MLIEKLEAEIVELLRSSIRNYVSAWHRIPNDVDVNDIKIKRIRFVKEWGRKTDLEEAYIIEFGSHKELLALSELGLSVDEYKALIKKQNEEYMLFAKDILIKTEWYEHPIVWGELDKTFDNEEMYQESGKYHGNEYRNFTMKYDREEF